MTEDSEELVEAEAPLSLAGAEVLAAAADLGVWRLPDGQVCLESLGKLYVLESEDTLRLDYGGMAAITGIVSIVVWLTQQGKRKAIFALSIDVQMSSDDPAVLRKRYSEVLQLAAAEAGITFEER